ncbi:glycosyltransferase [Halomonas qaidamensis]|uniref:Glycosyltransferase n=1 Tax=Halomonas qaidamensis TaxID=2866211 RepID=A0ABY6JLJ3_9GAMM|nr:glycosyltransferase [Halomonas qaidamensis]UYV18048.1 glycosyltransferase [Halomonas qaidamensis]
MDELLSYASTLAEKPAYPINAPIQGRIAYVVSHGQTYASNGYAIRTQGIAQALNQHGFETLCFVRPGRPWELHAESKVAPESTIEGVRYIHTRWQNDKAPVGNKERLEANVKKYVELFKVYRPSAVLAASNHAVGLPAWIAAKHLGLPFYNEVRGFWELSRAAREAEYKNTAAFKLEAERDAFVAKQAQTVFTLSKPMKDELVKRGVKASNIALVPNGVSQLPNIKPVSPALKKKLGITDDEKVIGYIGSFSAYEGLEVLLDACTQLVAAGEKLKLLLVGDDQPITTVVSDSNEQDSNGQVGKAEQARWLIQVGRVPHDQVADYYSLIDSVVIPRKPLAVCKLVPPMKAAEALAHGKRLVVSGVAPLAEYADKYEGVVSFEAGSAASLATALQESLKLSAPKPSTELLFSVHTKAMVKALKVEIEQKAAVETPADPVESAQTEPKSKAPAKLVSAAEPKLASRPVDKTVVVEPVTCTLIDTQQLEITEIEVRAPGAILELSAEVAYRLARSITSRKALLLFEFLDKFGKAKKKVVGLGVSGVFKKPFIYLNHNASKLGDNLRKVAEIAVPDDVVLIRIAAAGFGLKHKEAVHLKVEGQLRYSDAGSGEHEPTYSKTAREELGRLRNDNNLLNRKVIKLSIDAEDFSPLQLQGLYNSFTEIKRSVASIVAVIKPGSRYSEVYALWKDCEGAYVDRNDEFANEQFDLAIVGGVEAKPTNAESIVAADNFSEFCKVAKHLYTPLKHHAVYFAYSEPDKLNNGYHKRTKYLSESFLELGYSIPVISYKSNRFALKEGITFIPDDDKLIELILLWITPRVVIAASNHENASRIIPLKDRLGFEFVYEMRGLWHETFSAKMQEISSEHDVENDKFYLKSKQQELDVVKQSDKVVFISPEMRDYVAKDLPERQLIAFVAGNGVLPKAKHEVSQHKASRSPFVIGYFGAITYYEGINFLLETVKELAEEGAHDIEVLLIGNNSITQKWVLDIDKYPFARHEGFKQDIAKEYPRVNLFVIPRKPYAVCHTVEPLKPFEYFASGLPLLMSDCAALNRVAGYGENCLTFKAGDKESFKEKIKEVKEKGYPAEKIANAINYVKESRRWKDIAQGYANFLGLSKRKSVYFLYGDKWWVSAKWSGATVNLINEMIMIAVNYDVYYNDVFVNDLIDEQGVFDEKAFSNRCSKEIGKKNRKMSKYLSKIMLPSRDYAAIFYRSGGDEKFVKFFIEELPEPKIYSHNYVKEIWTSSFVGFQNETAAQFAKEMALNKFGDDGTLSYGEIDVTPKKTFIRFQGGVTQRPSIREINNLEMRSGLKRKLGSEFIVGVIGTIYEGTYPDSLIKVVEELREKYPEKNIQVVFYTINVLKALPEKDWIHVTSFEKSEQAKALLQLDVIVNTWKANAQLFSGSNKNLDAVNFGIPLITAKTPSYVEQLGRHYPLFHDFENTVGRLSDTNEAKLYNLIESCFTPSFVEQVRSYLLFRREFLSKKVVSQLYEDQVYALHKKKVLITAQNFNVGGVQKYSMQMLEALSNCEVTIAVDEAVKEEKLSQAMQWCSNLKVVLFQGHDFNKDKYDIAFMNSFPVDEEPLRLLTSALHDNGCEIYPIVHTDIHRFTKNIAHDLDKHAGIITVANVIISKLEENTGVKLAQKSHLITPVLDSDRAPRQYASPKTERSRKVGYFGRMVGIKGIEFLVKSFLKFSKDSGSDYELHLYGPIGQPYLGKYLEKVVSGQGSGKVFLHNQEISPDERVGILQDLDALIYTTAMDGLPYTFLEAMELGTPVLSTGVGGIKHLIRDEENGMLFDFPDLYVKDLEEKDPYGALLRKMKEHEELYYKEFFRVMSKFTSNDALFFKMSQSAIEVANNRFSKSDMTTKIKSIVY